MTFSFIVAYRNRNIECVKASLTSLQQQNFSGDYEIVFTDYGSDTTHRDTVEALCKSLSKVTYSYCDTRGQLWNKSQALNQSIAKSTGQYIIVVDIDLIYPPHFLTLLASKIDDKCFVQYQCYYLPKEITNYFNLSFHKSYPYRISTIKFTGGLIAIPRNVLYELGGFDEYFKMWGVEDIDMKRRLEKYGLMLKVLSIDEAPTFHQWHPPASTLEAMPKLWLKAMEKYAANKTSIKVPYLAADRQTTIKRPALKIFEDPLIPDTEYTKRFMFEYPIIQSYINFLKFFYAMPAGAALIIRQDFINIKTSKRTRLAGLFEKINHLLERLSISYRITEYATFETEPITFTNIRDFLFYFIADNQELIADYVFDTTFEKSIHCVLIKK